MSTFARAVVLAASLLGLAVPAGGQVLDTFDAKANGACPTEQQIEQANGRFTGQTGAGWTFVIAPQPSAYQNALPASEPSRVQPPVFGKVRLYGISRDGRRVLVGWYRGTSDRLCGWVPVAELLVRSTSADALKVLAEGPPVLQVKDLPGGDKRNTLTLKAVLSNLNIKGDTGIEAFVSPSESKVHTQLRLFEHFSVYDRKRGTPRGNDDFYYLLGKSEKQQEELLGWVHAEDVYLWNSRMAAFWTGKGHGRGWGKDDMSGPPLVTEEKFTEAKGHAQGRFPVLNMAPSPDQVQRLAAERLRTTQERTSLALSKLVDKYQLVLPGKSCRPGTRDCLSAEETEKARRELQARIDSQRRIDILFLIDATESMDVYFSSTAAAIRRFAQEELLSINREAALSVRISVAAYGDYKETTANPATVDYEKIVEFHDIGLGDDRRLAPIEEWARKRFAGSPQLDRHRDRLEAPFAGLVRSIGDARWRADAGFRFVIHLADHGNRELNKTSGEKDSQLVETVGIDAAAEALRSQRAIYVPISVLGRPNESDPFAQTARKAFIRQAGQLLEMRNLAPQGRGESAVSLSYRDTSTQESPAERQEAVLRAIRLATRSLLQANRVAALKELCARSAQNPACEELKQLETRDDVVSRINAVSAEEQGLTREQFDNVHSRSQTVTYAWVKPVDAVAGGAQDETLTYWVAMDRDRLRQMREGFNQLCAMVKPNSGDITARIRETIISVVKIETGDPDADLPASQTLAKALSLPFWERTEVLSLPIGTLSKIVQSNIAADIHKVRRAFCRAEFLLSLVERRLVLEDLAKLEFSDDGLVKNPPRNALREYDWFVKTDRGEGFYYVPVAYLP